MFTHKEIEQIARLTEMWASGSLKIDRRKFSKSVLHWSETMGLVKMVDGTMWTGDPFFDVINCTPPKAAFKLLKPALDRHSGFSINTAAEWQKLNIFPSTSRFDNVEHLQMREKMLLKLDRAGLITFLASGSVWRIEVSS